MRSVVNGRTVLLLAAVLLAGAGCANRMHDENEQLHHQNRELQAQLDAQRAQGASDDAPVEPAPLQPQAPAPATQPVLTRTPAPIDVPGTETTQDPVAGTMTVRVPGDVLFDPGRAVVRDQAKGTLDKVAAALKKDYSGKQIRVEGHTDSDPIRVSRWKSNQELSEARADAVKKYLVSKGVDASMVNISGFGSARPKSNDKAANRRVEIVVVTR